MDSPNDQTKSPDQLQLDRASGGIDSLSERSKRYGKAKSIALDVAQYIADHVQGQDLLAAHVRSCGDYLLFRHYFTVDQVRLHAGSFCNRHLLCPLCAIRRGSKALKAYLDRWEVIRA